LKFWVIFLNNRFSKQSIRDELRRTTEEFVSRGGEIKCHGPRESGQPTGSSGNRAVFFTGEPRQPRTYVNDAVSAVNDRKQKKIVSKPVNRSPRRPVKKIIYDDFGEPLREVYNPVSLALCFSYSSSLRLFWGGITKGFNLMQNYF
jgi:hypothetical protein